MRGGPSKVVDIGPGAVDIWNMVAEGSMLQLYALAILHMHKTCGFSLLDKTGGFLFLVITVGFPLMDVKNSRLFF
jgi:hypothetical protein